MMIIIIMYNYLCYNIKQKIELFEIFLLKKLLTIIILLLLLFIRIICITIHKN